MFTALLIVQVLLALVIIGLVLLQQGKGADMGAAFGAGASGTVFGAGGGGSFFSRATGVLAALFFANSILLSSPLVRDPGSAPVSVTESVPAPAPVAEEQDVPDLPVVEEQDMPDLPVADDAVEPETLEAQPADLPEVPEAAPAGESDLPE